MFRPVPGAVLAVAVGLLLWLLPLGDAWTKASYDYLFRFSTYAATNQVVLVLMDDHAYTALVQTRGHWNRALHAQLLNQLADEGCPLVAVDIRFEKAQEASADQALAAALRRLPKVVLATKTEPVEKEGLAGEQMVPPLSIFLNAEHSNWGVAKLHSDEVDKIVRQHWPLPDSDPDHNPSLAEQAARLTGVRLVDTPGEKWLRYYDYNPNFTKLEYQQALAQPPGCFHDKIVFIGNQPAFTSPDSQETDAYQVPQSRWTGETVGGVEILVAEFLNLENGDWLRRFSVPVEALVPVGLGCGLGILAGFIPRKWMILAALTLALALVYGGVFLSAHTNYWFPWLIVAGGQLPCAFAWAWFCPKLLGPDPLPAVVPVAARVPVPQKTMVMTFPADIPDTPDFELFQPPIGQGAFGKVWIMRNAIGQWQALKAIYQSNFGDNTKPLEAEFKGLQRYKPVSEKHPGLLRIELISKMKPEGYFYYVMELADAQTPDWEPHPAAYRPKDLEHLRKQAPGRRFPVAECLRLGLILADALDFLHQQGLIHRDIKPSNVIFVNGRPKLADIGLVTEIKASDQVNTLVGTPGYMPPLPERPGTVQADIYALGMMLYVISTGQDPGRFPDITTCLVEQTSHQEFLRLDAIIIKACQPDLALRYSSTAALLKDLQAAAQEV